MGKKTGRRGGAHSMIDGCASIVQKDEDWGCGILLSMNAFRG